MARTESEPTSMVTQLRLARALASAIAPRDEAGAATREDLRLFDALVTHTELSAASRPLYRDRHYAKAVEEGQKALIAYVQERSGRDADGTGLMESVFSPKSPILMVNGGHTRIERDEQEGYMRIFAGIVLMARNPRVHNHKLVDTQERALALLAFTNHLFEVVDNTALVAPPNAGA